MEDRYLFRGKRIDNGEWVVGHFYEFMGRSYIFEPPFTSKNLTHEVDPSTICQCTGLKDKNGKMIWENDIVVYYDMTEERYLISWESNKACYEYQQYGCSMMNFDELSGCEIEVLGNIFDNPELLEV